MQSFSLLVLVLAALCTPAASFSSPSLALSASVACRRAPATAAMAARTAAKKIKKVAKAAVRKKKGSRAVSDTTGSSKIPGLTALAPFKAYAVFGALIWAVVGSLSH